MKQFFTVLTFVLFFGILFTNEPHANSEIDQSERIAIISAFGPELVKLKSQATIEKEIVINGKTFTFCEVEGKKAVIFLSGISMINAAITTQMALDTFNISHILFSGIAGGVNPDLNIGDVTIPGKWAQYQESLFARKTAGGYNLGWHKETYTPYGMMYPQNVGVTHGRSTKPDAIEPKFWFEVDKTLLAIAEKISKVNLLSQTKEARLSSRPKLVVGGTGVSGMTFVDNAEYRQWVFNTFKADCLDMESAAVAHVAYVANVPFIAFRSLSDLAGGGEAENELETFFNLAADNAAEVLLQFLATWQ